ncbi:YciI family protein [Kineococcus sp. NUM-3379]
MPQYLLLIHGDESAWAALGEAELAEAVAAHERFTERNAAVLRGGEALQPTSTATSVRPDGEGGFTVTDGPFAETKEALGGYYVVEVADLDEALAVARQVPVGTTGGVEVRPVEVYG